MTALALADASRIVFACVSARRDDIVMTAGSIQETRLASSS